MRTDRRYLISTYKKMGKVLLSEEDQQTIDLGNNPLQDAINQAQAQQQKATSPLIYIALALGVYLLIRK